MLGLSTAGASELFFSDNVRRAALGVATGGASEALYFMPKKNAEEQAAIQREANRQQEALAKRQAGTTPQAKTESMLADTRKKKSALRRTAYTNMGKNAQKLGD